MLFLGIDVGKNTHMSLHSLMRMEKRYSMLFTTNGVNSLLMKLSDYTPDSIRIGMEATGHYWLSLYSFLLDAGYPVYAVNPIQTDGWRKGTEIHYKIKTLFQTDINESDILKREPRKYPLPCPDREKILMSNKSDLVIELLKGEKERRISIPSLPRIAFNQTFFGT